MPPRKKVPPQAKKTAEAQHVCRECANVTEVTAFNTLTVYGRQPTLGTCPYWKSSRCVLLSQKACGQFKNKGGL